MYSPKNKYLYCLSGLGADERIFSQLAIPGVEFRFLQWIQPQRDETMTSYASRMIAQLDTPEPTLLGVSFGGMVAIEIAKQCPGARVILVSSVKSRKELPLWMRWSGNLQLYKLVPLRPPRISALENLFLGAESEQELQLVAAFKEKTDPAYLQWAIGQVLTWQNEWRPAALFHIHGDKDRTFPLHRIKPTHVIPGGGHFMVLNRAREVSEILSGICSEV